jgi:hypothetical protein
MIGYDRLKRTGTKIHSAVEQNGLPIPIVISSANRLDATKFVDMIENVSEYSDDGIIEQIVQCCTDKGCDSKTIQNYLELRNIPSCVRHRNFNNNNDCTDQNNHSKTRFAVFSSVWCIGEYWGELTVNLGKSLIQYETKYMSNCARLLPHVCAVTDAAGAAWWKHKYSCGLL